jgi:hypothetical protein
MALPTSSAEIRVKAPVAGIDPDVKIPRAISAQGERADQIQRAIAGSDSTADGKPPSPQGEPPAPVPQPTPTEPEDQSQDSPSPHEDPATGGEPADAQNWERRFKGLQGRYDRDVRQMRENVSLMSDQIRQLQSENATLRTAMPAPTQQANGAAAPAHTLLTPQEIEDYGPEFVDVARRIAQEVAGPLQAEVHSLRAQLGTVQQETGNSFLQRMDREISAEIKDWAALNRDQRFVEWVKLPDVFSGAIRQQLMQEAWNAGDSRRVVAFFRAFLTEEAAVDPRRANGQMRQQGFNRTVTPTPSPVAPPTQEPQLALEDLAAPGRAHSAGGSPAEKPVYTSADLTRFWTDVAHGRWRGREAQQQAVEADIMQAQKEGRIITDQRSVLPHDPRAPQR